MLWVPLLFRIISSSSLTRSCKAIIDLEAVLETSQLTYCLHLRSLGVVGSIIPIHAHLPRKPTLLTSRAHWPGTIAARLAVAARLAGKRDLCARATAVASGASASAGRHVCWLWIHRLVASSASTLFLSGQLLLLRNDCETMYKLPKYCMVPL